MTISTDLRRKLFVKEILVESAKNLMMAFKPLRELRVRLYPRTSISAVAPATDTVDRYAFTLLRKLHSSIGSLKNKDIAEIGPGDHVATGLVMLAAGARSYTSLDRFPGEYSNAYAKAFYRKVHSAWSSSFPDLPWPNWLDPNIFPEGYANRVSHIRVGVESIDHLEDCDVVCSYAVGEHVLDVDAFSRTSFKLLREGGSAVHVVDFSQHFDWSWYGDRFLYLSIPDWLWYCMGSNRGLPNRVLFFDFRDAFVRTGFQVDTLDQVMADEGPVLQNLLPRFRRMPMESLRTLEATFVCRKFGRGRSHFS